MLFCEELDEPSNTLITYSNDDFEFGTEATYSCALGFGLAGDAVRICGGYLNYHGDIVGRWSGKEPECLRKYTVQAMIVCKWLVVLSHSSYHVS